MRFSSRVTGLLEKAGWHDGRRVPFELPKEWHDSDLVLHEAARSVLREFYDLRIACESNPVHHEDFVGSVDVLVTYRGATPMIIDTLRKSTECEFVCVALVECEDEIFIDRLGRIIYNHYDLYYYASSFDNFLERILTGTRRESPPEDLQPGIWKLL